MKSLVSAAALALLMATPALAEDWTGFYAGAHAGYAWGNATTTDDKGPWCGANSTDAACIKKYVGPFDFTANGTFGGGTLGYNVRWDRIVVGVEGDLDYMDLNGSKRLASSKGDGSGDISTVYHQEATVSAGLYGDITGRVGFLITPSTLVYGKGGFAFYDGEMDQASTKPYYQSTGTRTFTGWTAGGGVERFITENISLKVEYMHTDFGSQGSSQEKFKTAPGEEMDDNTGIGDKFPASHTLGIDTIKAGVAYHW